MVTIPEKEVFRKTLVTGCWAIALSSLQEPTLPFPRIPRHSFGNNGQLGHAGQRTLKQGPMRVTEI